MTHEFTKTMTRPTAFTARSRKLWVKFSSDGNRTAQGFSIPYVTYDGECWIVKERVYWMGWDPGVDGTEPRVTDIAYHLSLDDECLFVKEQGEWLG